MIVHNYVGKMGGWRRLLSGWDVVSILVSFLSYLVTVRSPVHAKVLLKGQRWSMALTAHQCPKAQKSSISLGLKNNMLNYCNLSKSLKFLQDFGFFLKNIEIF